MNKSLEGQFFWEGGGVVVGMTVRGYHLQDRLVVQFRQELRHSLKPGAGALLFLCVAHLSQTKGLC